MPLQKSQSRRTITPAQKLAARRQRAGRATSEDIHGRAQKRMQLEHVRAVQKHAQRQAVVAQHKRIAQAVGIHVGRYQLAGRAGKGNRFPRR